MVHKSKIFTIWCVQKAFPSPWTRNCCFNSIFQKILIIKLFLYHYKVLTLSSPSTFLFQRNARHMEKQYFNSTFSWYKKWTEANLFILNKYSVVRKTNFKNTGTGTGRHLGNLSSCSEENMKNRNLCCKFHTNLPMVCNEINKSFYFLSFELFI